MTSSLQDLKNALAQDTFGMLKSDATKQDICIDCKQKPTFYSGAGRREYQISGLCEPCFDRITGE